jgi:hypothetical protein
MKRLLWLSAPGAILALLWASSSLAITVDFVPSTHSVGVGQPVTVGCRRYLCWNLFSEVSGRTRILDQAARSIDSLTSLCVNVAIRRLCAW